MTVSESIDLFLEHCEFEKHLSKNTLIFYKIDLLQFLDFLKSESIDSISEIDKSAIKAYVQKLFKFETRTIKRKIASSKAYLNFLEFEDYILVNPYRKVKIRIKEPQQLPTVLDLEEVKGLFLTLHNERNKIPNKQSLKYGEKLRDLSVLELLFATGVRVSELCGLRLEDLNLVNGSVLVKGKGNKERMVQICNDETMKTLNDYHELYKERIQSVGFFLSAA